MSEFIITEDFPKSEIEFVNFSNLVLTQQVAPAGKVSVEHAQRTPKRLSMLFNQRHVALGFVLFEQ